MKHSAPFIYVIMKGCSSVMGIYGSSVVKALIDVYPEVIFDKELFKSTASMLYFIFIPLSIKESIARSFNPSRRREVFDNFAARNNFDPNVPENWYSHSLSALKNDKVFIFSILFLLLELIITCRIWLYCLRFVIQDLYLRL